ncbi:hypothetical protein [Microbacterium sp. 22242]|uniref:hypothetical protein n=1 Tax=Microbacterium sp. 22242 TaxID=3453896 RepID=UPI003F82F019
MGAEDSLRQALDIVRAIQLDTPALDAVQKITAATTTYAADEGLTVFVSWAHTQKGWNRQMIQLWQESVATLASTLRQKFGIDADVDLFHLDEMVDWTRFGQRAVEQAGRVVVVLSRSWAERWSGTNAPTEGAGAAREADTLHGLFSKDQSAWQAKIIVAVLPDVDESILPPDMDRVPRVRVDPSNVDSYDDLVRLLTGQPRYRKPPLGSVPELPPLDPQRNLATLRSQLLDVRDQEKAAKANRTAEGIVQRERLRAQEATLLGIIEASEQSQE